MAYTVAIFGDAGNSITNGTTFYYSPGKWQRYNIGASGPLQASVNAMMQAWQPNEMIQLGDESYNSSSSSLLDFNIGQYYNNFIYPYAPPKFVNDAIYTQAASGGIQANATNKQWPYNLYNYPYGFPNPLDPLLPGGSSDLKNHYWIVPGNHDEATIVGNYSDSNVNQVDFNQKKYIGNPQGPDAFDFASNIKPYLPNNNNNPNFNGQTAIAKVGSTQAFLDYHPWLNDNAPTNYVNPNQVHIGKANANGYGMYYSIDIGETEDDNGVIIPLMHYTFIDTTRLLTDAGYYDFNFDPSSPKNNFLYDPTKPLGVDGTPAPQHQDPSLSDTKIGYEMFQWALDDLKSSKAKWNILAGHHPGYNIGQASELLDRPNIVNTSNNTYSNIDVVIKFLAGLNAQLRIEGASPFDAYFNGHSHYYGRAMETIDSGKGIGLGIPSFTIGDGGKALDDIYPVAYGDSLFNYNYDDGSPLELLQLEDIQNNIGYTGPVSTGASGWTAKLIDSKATIQVNGTDYKFSIPVYTNGMGKIIDTGSDISGLYGYGSGAAKITADKDYFFTQYQTIETLDPAIVRIAQQELVTDYQRGSKFYKDWSPRSARLNDLALFSFNVKVDAGCPTGYLTDFTLVNSGNGYFNNTTNLNSTTYADKTIDFEINGNNPINPLPQDMSDPTRALVRLNFKNGQLQEIAQEDLIRAGTDYRNLLNAINVTNYDYTAIPDGGIVTKVPLLIGININLEAQTTFAEQGDNYQDWYLTTETAAEATSSEGGQFGTLAIAIKPKSVEAQNLIANTPITTGYKGGDYQQKYEHAQAGTIDLIDSLSQNIGNALIIDGIANINLSSIAAPGPIDLHFSGDPSSSYLINFKPSNTKISLDYGNWGGIVQISDNKIRFDQQALNLSVIRMDDYQGLIDFGIYNQDISIDLLKNAGPASNLSIGILGGYSDVSWLATEGHALGGNSSLGYSLSAGDWTPSAKLAGTSLDILSMSLSANNITVNFHGGIVASYGLPGTGSMINPSANQSRIEVTIQRLGSYGNGLAFYEADPITGAVGGLLPGQVGYLIAALANAKSSDLLLQPWKLPIYGQSLTFDSLPISNDKNYGILLLVNGREDNLFCSYSLANPYGAQQFTTLGSTNRGLTVGIEDIPLFINSDRDYNDLIVKFTSSAPLVTI